MRDRDSGMLTDAAVLSERAKYIAAALLVFGIFIWFWRTQTSRESRPEPTPGEQVDHALPTQAREPEPEPPPPESPEPKWYEGGTLHRANVSLWVSATDSNRLATCADFAATIIMNNSSTSLQRAYDVGVELAGHDGGMKAAAAALCICMNNATTDLTKKAQSQTMSDVAAGCVILMDARR